MSRPALHPKVVQDSVDVQSVSTSLATMVDARRLSAAATAAVVAADDAEIHVPIDSVSKDGSFDAYIHVGLVGGTGQDIKLMVDSGNTTLILPHLEAITQIPNYAEIYDVGTDTVTEPWGAPARLVTGPIVLPCEGGSYTIARCQFYACTGLNKDKECTANFGIGRVDPWIDPHGLQSPLSYDGDTNFVQIDYAPVDQVFSAADGPHVAPGSWLTLSKDKPGGYLTMFDILPKTPWMSLKPLSLYVGNDQTEWPGVRIASSIAMIDTGGGPVFLSDQQNYLRRLDFPGSVPEDIPDFWDLTCAGISGDLAFSLSDGTNTMSFSLPASALPQSVQGLSLVACQNCSYMFGWDGMNIGGLTALFYSILIDYKGVQVGFKAKNPDA